MRLLTTKILSLVLFASCAEFLSAAEQAVVDPLADGQSVHVLSVEYSGNNITQARLLDQQLYFAAPATISGQQLSDSIQAIKDLGLFESVNHQLQPVAGGYTLKIALEEKFYIIPLPRLGLNSDGETSYGASVEWDNVAGLNQRIKFVWERKQLRDDELGEREIFRLNYDYPRVAGSLWNGGFFISYTEVPVFETPAEGGREYVAEEQRHGVAFGRQLFDQGQTQGWFVDGSIFYLLEDVSPASRVPELVGGSVWAWSLGARYEHRNFYSYTEEGLLFSTNLEQSFPGLGADFSYNRFDVRWRLVKPGFSAANHHSVIYQAGLGIYNGGPPEKQGYSNNSGNLRGLGKGELEGNALLHASVEYLLPVLNKYPTWRYGAFVDAAVFAEDYTEFCGCDVHYSVGLSLVWRPKRLVKTELRAEYGYNVTQKASRAGGGISRF